MEKIVKNLKFITFVVLLIFLICAKGKNCIQKKNILLACDKEILNIYTVLVDALYDDIFEYVRKNMSGKKVSRSLEKLSNYYSMISKCKKIKCRKFTMRKKHKISSGWIENTEIISYKTKDRYGNKKCNVLSKISLEKNNYKITGRITTKTGEVRYTFPKVNCTIRNKKKYANVLTKREITLSEHGILLVDKNAYIKKYPGTWLFLKNKRIIQYKIVNNFEMKFIMANNVFFIFDAKKGRITKSNLLNSFMFNSLKCKTILKNEKKEYRTYTNIQYNGRDAKKRFVLEKLFDFGGVKQEESVKEIKSTLKRQNLY